MSLAGKVVHNPFWSHLPLVAILPLSEAIFLAMLTMMMEIIVRKYHQRQKFFMLQDKRGYDYID